MSEEKNNSKSDSKYSFSNFRVVINYSGNGKEEETPSAFRAVNSTKIQNVFADVPLCPVCYPDKTFDLNDEYNPDSSIFTPKQDGLYAVIAGVTFFPNIIIASYRVIISIKVNDIPVVTSNVYFGADPVETGDEASVSAILHLAAGDEVTVSVLVHGDTGGIIMSEPRGTHFEASRLPSPKIKFVSGNGTKSELDILSGIEL